MRRLALTILGIVLTLLLVAVVTGAFFLLRRSASDNSVSVGETPSGLSPADDQSPFTQEVVTATPLPESASPSPTAPASSRQPQTSLAVRIKYVRGARFDLTLLTVTRTWEIPTVQWQLPADGQPHSILEVYDGANTKIGEHKFSMPTTVALEGIEGSEPYVLPESELDIVAPLPSGTIPARVRIVTDKGEVLDERSFTYEELPQDVAQPNVVSLLWRALAGVSAWAATEDLTLVVINEADASSYLTSLVTSTRGMVNTIEPWATYKDTTRVVSLSNRLDLECVNITLQSGRLYPACPNSGHIIRIVQEKEPDWDGIVVANNIGCDCGTAFLGSQIVAGGRSISRGIVAHEFGHAIGSLADEYWYQFNAQGPSGPNCFASKDECETAIVPFAGDSDAQCSLGCNSTSTFRPSSRIMHNEYTKLVYGPFEECLMGQSLAKLFEGSHECSDVNESPTPTPEGTAYSTPADGTYWGGGR